MPLKLLLLSDSISRLRLKQAVAAFILCNSFVLGASALIGGLSKTSIECALTSIQPCIGCCPSTKIDNNITCPVVSSPEATQETETIGTAPIATILGQQPARSTSFQPIRQASAECRNNLLVLLAFSLSLSYLVAARVYHPSLSFFTIDTGIAARFGYGDTKVLFTTVASILSLITVTVTGFAGAKAISEVSIISIDLGSDEPAHQKIDISIDPSLAAALAQQQVNMQEVNVSAPSSKPHSPGSSLDRAALIRIWSDLANQSSKLCMQTAASEGDQVLLSQQLASSTANVFAIDFAPDKLTTDITTELSDPQVQKKIRDNLLKWTAPPAAGRVEILVYAFSSLGPNRMESCLLSTARAVVTRIWLEEAVQKLNLTGKVEVVGTRPVFEAALNLPRNSVVVLRKPEM